MRLLSLRLSILTVVLLTGCRSTSEQFWNAGKAELEAGNYEAAIEHLEASKNKDSNFAPAYLALAAAYSRQGEFESVAENLQKFVELNPDHDVAHLYLAECSAALGDNETARDEYLMFIHKAKPSEEKHAGRLVYCYQRLSELSGRMGSPFEVKLYNSLAMLEEIRLQQMGLTGTDNRECQALLQDAKKCLDEAEKLSPGDPRLAETLQTWSRQWQLATIGHNQEHKGKHAARQSPVQRAN